MYTILKPIIRLALFFYTKNIHVHFDKRTVSNEPKIIAANHPNSFFDAIIIAVFYPRPIYFLARGDAFKKPFISKLLKALHLIPIYRISEGRNNLVKNDATFKHCVELLKQGETILIFSEGICVNEWKLRSLKKGTARLALMALQEGIYKIEIQPTTINYSSFNVVPKNIQVHFNEAFKANGILYSKETDFYSQFNIKLKKGIEKKLITNKNHPDLQEITSYKNKTLQKLLLSLPAFIGWFTQKWFYNSIKKWVCKKTNNTVFYDSVLFGMLLLTYPIFIALCTMLFGIIFDYKIGLIVLFSIPLSGYCYKWYRSI